MKNLKALVLMIALFAGASFTTAVAQQASAPAAAQVAPAVVPAAPAAVAPAAEVKPPESPEQALGLLPALMAAIRSGNWAVVASLGIMLAIYLLRMFVLPKLKVSASKLPYISAGVGILIAFAANLGAGQSWIAALLSGLTMGAAASGFWSLIGSSILPKAPEAPKA
jgi:hypothetical protein